MALFQNTPGTNWEETTDKKYTKTGVGFGCGETVTLPDIPTGIKEMWAKYDKWNSNYGRGCLFKFKTASTYCGTDGGQNSYPQIYVNGTRKVNEWMFVEGAVNTVWLHLKSDANDGIFEIFINGAKKYEFTGDILHGEDITEICLQTYNKYHYISNIIVSDSPIALTEQVVTIPCTITTDMTKNEDGSYNATAVNQTLEYAINASSFDAETKFTGVNIAARNCIKDGEGVDEFEFLEGNTSLDTQTIPTAENCGLSYGITLNEESPATFALHNYKLKAK